MCGKFFTVKLLCLSFSCNNNLHSGVCMNYSLVIILVLVPLFFQRQGGVHAAGLGVRAAPRSGGGCQGGRGGSQHLLSPALLPQMLMLRQRLGHRVLGLPVERGVRSLIFGRAFRAVKLCWRKERDERRCESLCKESTDSLPEFELSSKPPVNIE